MKRSLFKGLTAFALISTTQSANAETRLWDGAYVPADNSLCSLTVTQGSTAIMVQDGPDCSTSYTYEYTRDGHSNEYIAMVNGGQRNVLEVFSYRSFTLRVETRFGGPWNIVSKVFYTWPK